MEHPYTGAEDFELELGPWSVLGQRALVAPRFEPDFDAVALPPCRLLRIPRSAYAAALAATRPGTLSLPAVGASCAPCLLQRCSLLVAGSLDTMRCSETKSQGAACGCELRF